MFDPHIISYVHAFESAVHHLMFQEEMTREREVANRLLHRLMEVAYDTFKEMGGSTAELQEMQRKRSYIQACYFQAISCY